MSVYVEVKWLVQMMEKCVCKQNPNRASYISYRCYCRKCNKVENIEESRHACSRTIFQNEQFSLSVLTSVCVNLRRSLKDQNPFQTLHERLLLYYVN